MSGQGQECECRVVLLEQSRFRAMRSVVNIVFRPRFEIEFASVNSLNRLQIEGMCQTFFGELFIVTCSAFAKFLKADKTVGCGINE